MSSLPTTRHCLTPADQKANAGVVYSKMDAPVETTESLRERILAELVRVEACRPQASKAELRSLHEPAVEKELARCQMWIASAWRKYARYFADGDEIDPDAVQPILVEVVQRWHSDLFRLARLTWSLPFSKGYGRRLRFLVLDATNDKLIGIVGFQSPPLDFPARDRLFDYPIDRKVELVNQTMDVFTLGAVPPYSFLLGGKLTALAAASNEVQAAYERKYTGRVTAMGKQVMAARLVALTTTSAFGRSSLYNRLIYCGRPVAQPIGYTEGYGSFHLATLYPDIRKHLEALGVSTRGGFGVGPRIVWQTLMRASQRMGLPRRLLQHGVRREAFLFPLASNLKDYMEGRAEAPAYYQQPFSDLSVWWKERWLRGRAARVTGWQNWNSTQLENQLKLGARITDADSILSFADERDVMPIVVDQLAEP